MQPSTNVGEPQQPAPTACCDSTNLMATSSQESCCCSSSETAAPDWICGYIETPVGSIPQIRTTWNRADVWGQIKARTTAFRMQYDIEPGLYAIGTPDADSDVVVSANYKLSFDILRRELAGLNVWVLVLDTQGINVWCAAGKGTFGTDELARRVERVRLKELVAHRRLIVPQLGAPGVSGPRVKGQTGFRVLFGPVEARDLPAYFRANRKATPEMRRVTFPLGARLVLTPLEIVPALKYFPLYAVVTLGIFGLQPAGILFGPAWSGGWPFLLAALISILAGALLTPALLPVVPFRSFAVKGWIVGLAAVLISHVSGLLQVNSNLLTVVLYLLFPLAASYIALQFTGSTPFTGISGVQKELRIGIPFYLTGAGLSAILLIIDKILQWA